MFSFARTARSRGDPDATATAATNTRATAGRMGRVQIVGKREPTSDWWWVCTQESVIEAGHTHTRVA